MKCFIVFLLIISAASYSQTSYRFVILGDRTDNTTKGVFPKIVGQTLALKPAPLFYTNVGDLIQGFEKNASMLSPQWSEVDSELTPIVKRFPWHPVAGNHDISYDSILPFYRHSRGPSYYAYDVGPDRFIVLDNSRFEEPAKMDSAQLAFLKKTLAGSAKVRYLFCFYHKPFFHFSPRENRMDSLHALFKAVGVDYVFNGHYHSYIHGIRDNIHYVDIGSSGGDNAGGRATGDAFHYGLVDVSPNGVRFRPVTMEGETLSIDWVTDTVLQEKAAWQEAFNFKSIDLSWKDISMGTGVFELVAKNPLKIPVTVALAWDPPPQTSANPWKLSPDTLLLPLPPDSTRILSFNYELNGIAAGPKIDIRVPVRKDTLTVLKRVLVRRQMVVSKAGGKIVMDGLFREKAWRSSLKNAGNVFGSVNRHEDYDSTWISFLYDGVNLYGGFICYDPSPESLVVETDAGVRDKCTGVEDVISFFINDPADTVFLFSAYFNPVGAIRDAKARIGFAVDEQALSWTGVAESRVIKTKTGWQGEFRIPWKAMGWDKPQPFRFNCKRPSNRFPERSGNVAYQIPFDRDGGASTWLAQ